MSETVKATSGSLNIHSENLLPIIKKWLYSEHDIFLRELASNALDAIVKRRILESRKEVPHHDHNEDRIDITIDHQEKAITVSDTGVGMSQEEAVKYLSQIAFSGAEEFMKTYQMKDGFIGHFGLGFFSSFMVADNVEVTSKSARDGSSTILWTSDGSTKYSVGDAREERAHVGTDVRLFVNKESEEFLETTKMEECLKRFCRFFPVPIYLNGSKINTEAAIWTKSPQDVSEEEYLGLYRTLYPFKPDPLFWIHLNVDYPFHVQGILYFPSQLPREHEAQKDGVFLYCNKVFVSSSCKDILPEYLTIMSGVIDSPDIPLNVSRSHLQVDRTVKTLSTHIAKKVSDALTSLAKSERAKFEKVWPSCEVIVKLGMLEDDKFYDRLFDTVLLKILKESAEEPCYKNLGQLVESSTTTADEPITIVYCDPGQEKSPIVRTLQEKGRDVVITTSALDHSLISRLEHKKPHNSAIPLPDKGLRFRRVDSELVHEIVDPSRERTILDGEGKTEASRIADFFRNVAQQGDTKIEVEAKSLAVDSIPAFITLNEEERRARDYSQRFLQGAGQDFWKQMKPKSTLIVNTNNSTIRSIVDAKNKEPALAKEMAEYVVALAKLMHNELSATDFERFVQQSSTLLGHVAQRIST